MQRVPIPDAQAGPPACVTLSSFPCPSNHSSPVILQSDPHSLSLTPRPPPPPAAPSPNPCLAGPPFTLSRSPGQRLLSSWHLRGLCRVHVTPAGARTVPGSQDLLCSSARPSVALAAQPGWDMRSSERRRPLQAEGQTLWGSQNGRTMGQCPATSGPQGETLGLSPLQSRERGRDDS